MTDTPTSHLNPPTRWTLCIGILVVAVCVVLYLANPPFLDLLNNKIMDAVVANNPASAPGDGVVVVEIDEMTLGQYGQWPWPRYQLARLLSEIAKMGPTGIALDFVMPEPDRTSLKALQEAIQRDYGYQLGTHALPEHIVDNDAVLADALSKGPFVLGYEFLFEGADDQKGSCSLHPLTILRVQKGQTPQERKAYHQAQDVVCNLERFSKAVSNSGFLNGHPDADGVLRRLPLVILYGNDYYPSLALASLLQAGRHTKITFRHTNGGPDNMIFGGNAIPIDRRGYLRVNFRNGSETLRHVSAGEILAGRVSKAVFDGNLVFVGLLASGLNSVYPAPTGALLSEVDIHAQLAETILSENYIRRSEDMVHFEVLAAVLLGLLFSLYIAKFEVAGSTIVGALAIVGVWQGALLFFQNGQFLFSPFLPVGVILFVGVFLSLFKYWSRQRTAHQSVNDAVILMRGSEKKLNAIIQTIPDIVFRLDASGRITFISPAIMKYAKQPEELIGTHILDIVAPEDRGIAEYKINERRTGERATSDMEMRLLLSPPEKGAAGEERYFSVSAEGIYTKDAPDKHSFMGTQGIARDISRRKLLEYQLEQSKKMEAIGSLAAGVAHDLNNILSGLVSYPELLLLDIPPDSPMRKKIETIQRSGQRAAAIVQDMLTIARQGVRNSEILLLNTVVADYLRSPECRKICADHAGIDLKTDLSNDLMNMKGSRVHILKVIMNLVNNAAEAMPAGGRITLLTCNRYLDKAWDTYEQIPEGEYVRFSALDEGVGIAPEDLPRVFEPFYTKKKMGQSGSGLGMTVIWNTVKDHGGYVDIHSREGEGSRFDIYFPVTREVPAEKERRVVLQDYIGTEKILVVDDVPEQRDIAVRMLGKLGYEVLSLPSGEQAVEFMATHTVDLLVLDMVMLPGIDGLETFRRIRQKHPDQKAIIASGFSESERVKALQALGAGTYLRKPYTLEKIGIAVRGALDGTPST
ncbi:MAG: CHASE2 domain-containing protein [Desulfobacteraceae bacterium]|nr:CHASE2 domain-containing protein [Desulfobacteraceae bacterium]MBC2751197.1 CHASE2 domain-containing protein [Desulfobacteraceae bacterium]